MDAGDDDVELGEGGVFEVELRRRRGCRLRCRRETEGCCWFDGVGLFVFEALLVAGPLRAALGCELFGEVVGDFADAGGVGEGAVVVHAVGHGEIFGVVGDGDVVEAAGDGGFGHLADGVGAVGLGGVHVEVAAEVARVMRCGRVCLAAASSSPQFSRSSGGM